MTDPYTADLSQILVKAKRGQPLSPQERATLQEAMKGVAPSSPEFNYLSEALSSAGPPPGLMVGEDAVSSPPLVGAEAAPYNTAGNTPNMRQPTMDWAAGAGGVKDAIFDEFQDPFGGNPDLRSQPSAAPDLSWESDDGNGNSVPQTSYNDPSPLPGQTPTKNINYEGTNHGIGGPTLAGGYGSEVPIGDEDFADVDVANFPGGYSFSGGNETSVDLFARNPELFNRNLTENVLDQPGMDSFWENKTRAAMNMSSLGLLGNGSGRDDLGGGPTTSTGQLAATEDFMKQFAQPGVQTVNPGDIYRQIFERAGNTDWSTQMSRQGNGPMGPEEIADTTNSALLTSMGFSTPETEAWMTSLLENAKMEYMMYLAQGGDTSVSYPKFLDETMDFSQLL